MPTGPSTSQSPYLLASEPNVSFTSILAVGDIVPGAISGFIGRLDGIGAFSNGNGTATVLVNHEIGAAQGNVRAHGSAGAFVERLTINTSTLQVIGTQDAANSVFLDPDGDGIYASQTTAWSNFCSGDLAPSSAFFTQAGSLGTTERIYLTGEEAGAEGRAFAFVLTGADAGRAYELPRLGNMSFENVVANPGSSQTIAMMMDDTSPLGQVYMYLGTRQASGNTVERAGLTNGQLYGVRVTGMVDEAEQTALTNDAAVFSMVAVANAQTLTGAQVQTQSEASGISEFMRPEDGAWDPTHPNWFYFNTTATFAGHSRLWRLEFNDIDNPAAGGTIRMLLRGDEGQHMLDNITVTADGHVIVLEDAGNNPHLGRVLIYDPVTDSLEQLGIHDAARFLAGGAAFLTQDEESSGVIDVTGIFGNANRQAFLIGTQAHYSLASPLVEGGQLQIMYIDKPQNGGAGNDTINGGAGVDILSGGGGDDTMRGGSNNDQLSGDGGNDVIDGGIGADFLNGGAGDDRFLYRPGDGADLISGFAAGPGSEDRINLAAFQNISSFADVLALATQAGADTIINFGSGNTLTLQNVLRSSLGGDDFVFTSPKNDCNGDLASDLLWRNGGTFTEWQMHGSSAAPNVYVNSTVSPIYASEGTLDFNGDNMADLFWRDTSNGAFTIWDSTGNSFAQNSYINTTVNTSWHVAGFGDFNADGKDDLIWRNDNGAFTEWQSTGSGFAANVVMNTSVSTAWHLGAVADFNGDGKADLLWRNNNGTFTEWQSTGNGFTQNAYADMTVDPSWHLAGTGDFNGDGKADLLWRNNGGTFTEWQSNGAGFTRNTYVDSTVNNSWHLAQIGDFNGDGNDDLLWRNDNGPYTTWQSTGNGFILNVQINTTVPTDWTLITHHYDLV